MLNNLRIVMVRPRGSGNIGSVARAMKNVGAKELAIVGNARTQSFWAKAMAVHGRDILQEAKRHPTIREAIDEALTPEERERFVDYLRPLVEEGKGVSRPAVAYLRAVKP